MTGGIFLVNPDDSLTTMRESTFSAEDVLQGLLARYPDLLAGDQMDPVSPRRWLLVTRESPIPGEQDGTGRWSLDHLFLDQETFIEVKRSTDTRLRREVVGQMLDYAANAIAYWPIEEIHAQFERRCEKEGAVAEDLLAEFLGPTADQEAFWTAVKTNLQAERVRLVFVADEIPLELRRIVEFLNRQLDPAEVLAVEIKQFSGDGRRTFVPRVLGQLDQKANHVKGPKKQWEEGSFFVELEKKSGTAATQAARRLLAWAKEHATRIWWGQGASDGGFVPVLQHKGQDHVFFTVWTYGRVEVTFQFLKNRPPFDDEGLRIKLLDRLNQVPGVSFPKEVITKRPRILLEKLANPETQAAFLGVLDRIVAEIESSSAPA